MKRQAKLYGVFIGSKWGMCRNKRTAIQHVRKIGQGEVREMPLPGDYSWDAPTFRVCSVQIYKAR